MPPRQKNTSADFILSKYPDQYDVATVQNLIKHFGVSYSMILLQELVKMRKAKDESIMDIHDARLDCVLPSKRKLYANALALQGLVLSQDLSSQIKGAFFADSIAISSNMMTSIQTSSTLEAEQQQKYTEKQRLDMAAMYCFDVCYHLAFIRNLPQSEIIVERINRALHLVNIDSSLDPEMRMSLTLKDVVRRAMDFVVGPKVYRQLDMQYGVDVHRFHIMLCSQRKDHNGCHDPKVAGGETQTINKDLSHDLSSMID